MLFLFPSIVFGLESHLSDTKPSTRGPCCLKNSAIPKPILQINKLLALTEFLETEFSYRHSASATDMQKAPCRDISPPTVVEMEEWLKTWAGSKKGDEQTHGVQFSNESPKMIDLFQKLKTYEVPGWWTIQYTMQTKCQRVICAAKQSFGNTEGVQLLYMLARYGFNGSPYPFQEREGWTFWRATELDKILVALSDFPEGLLPLTENYPLNHFKRGSTLKVYTKIEKMGVCVKANMVIQVFDCASRLLIAEYQQVIFHEVAHVLGNEYGLDESSAWYGFAGWEETTTPNGKIGFNTNYKANNPKCVVSIHGGINPREGFAESLVAYRYNPKPMKNNCPEKYMYLKDLVFDGIEYLDDSGCKDKKLLDRWFPSLNRWIRSIKYTF